MQLYFHGHFKVLKIPTETGAFYHSYALELSYYVTYGPEISLGFN